MRPRASAAERERDAAVRRAFGAQLRATRMARGWSQEQVVGRADLCDRKQLVAFERGRAAPSLPTLVRLCAALECSAADLVPRT